MHEAGLLGAVMVGGTEDLRQDGCGQGVNLGWGVLVDSNHGGLDAVQGNRRFGEATLEGADLLVEEYRNSV